MTVRETAARLADEHPETHEDVVAAEAVRGLDDSTVRELAALALAGLIAQERRRRQWEIERRAIRERNAAEKAQKRKPKPAKEPDPEPIRTEEQKADDAYWAARRQAISDRQREAFQAATDKYREAVTLEVTAELLASSFALGDGRRVTWAAATIDDHRDRVALLHRQAVGTIETAAIHEKAIETLAAQGISTLGEMAVAA